MLKYLRSAFLQQCGETIFITEVSVYSKLLWHLDDGKGIKDKNLLQLWQPISWIGEIHGNIKWTLGLWYNIKYTILNTQYTFRNIKCIMKHTNHILFWKWARAYLRKAWYLLVGVLRSLEWASLLCSEVSMQAAVNGQYFLEKDWLSLILQSFRDSKLAGKSAYSLQRTCPSYPKRFCM